MSPNEIAAARQQAAAAGDQASTKTGLFGNVGDVELLGAMIPEVYEQLRDLAENYLRGERANHTLQATALVRPNDRRDRKAPEDFACNRETGMGHSKALVAASVVGNSIVAVL
jgi:hypothetical protein